MHLYLKRRHNMTLLKSGLTFSPLIISRMVFVCNSCKQVDIISEKDYTPNLEKKCSKCQSIMVLSSTNTDVYDTPAKPNDYFENLSKE